MELRDSEHRKIVGYDSGVITAENDWKLAAGTLFGYAPGVRYLYWEVSKATHYACMCHQKHEPAVCFARMEAKTQRTGQATLARSWLAHSFISGGIPALT